MTTSEYASIDDLMEGDDLSARPFTLPNGKKVSVRGLSAFERKLLYKGLIVDGGISDPQEVEKRLIHYGVVVPAMTMEQAEAWMKAIKMGTLDALSNEIRRLSGMLEGAEKS